MPRAMTIDGFIEGCQKGNKEHQCLALYQFDIDVHHSQIRGIVKF